MTAGRGARASGPETMLLLHSAPTLVFASTPTTINESSATILKWRVLPDESNLLYQGDQEKFEMTNRP